MTSSTPKLEDSTGLLMPEPPQADYCDEVTEAQLDALRTVWPQTETAMGPMVHEFVW